MAIRVTIVQYENGLPRMAAAPITAATHTQHAAFGGGIWLGLYLYLYVRVGASLGGVYPSISVYLYLYVRVGASLGGVYPSISVYLYIYVRVGASLGGVYPSISVHIWSYIIENPPSLPPLPTSLNLCSKVCCLCDRVVIFGELGYPITIPTAPTPSGEPPTTTAHIELLLVSLYGHI